MASAMTAFKAGLALAGDDEGLAGEDGGGSEEHEGATGGATSLPKAPKAPNQCAFCRKKKKKSELKPCPCRLVRYCDLDCWQEDWKVHKKACGKHWW